jgi:hypothetical protein
VIRDQNDDPEGPLHGAPAAMTSDRYVPTPAIRQAVRGHETTVLAALGITWRGGAQHIACPYPDHADQNPSWRWVERKARAYCTCVERSHSIFDVVMRIEGVDFETAKLRVAEILGCHDLIVSKDGQRMDAASLLPPPADQRDDALVRSYLASRRAQRAWCGDRRAARAQDPQRRRRAGHRDRRPPPASPVRDHHRRLRPP